MKSKTSAFLSSTGTLLRELPSWRLIVSLATAVLVLFLIFRAGYRVQLSDSGPKGIWHFKASAIERGRWVAVCPEPMVAALAQERGYIPEGPCAGNVSPILKRVVALAGDTVEIGPAGMAVDGVLLPDSAIRATDRESRPLPHPEWGTYTVEPGTLWVANAVPDSFDSRYFGAVDEGRVLAVADAVLVMSDGASP